MLSRKAPTKVLNALGKLHTAELTPEAAPRSSSTTIPHLAYILRITTISPQNSSKKSQPGQETAFSRSSGQKGE